MLPSRLLRKGRRALAVCLASVWLLEACGAGWHQPADLGAKPLSPRQQVQVWQDGSVARWHALVVTPDTVSGIPYRAPIDCDSCRVAVPRAAVDSVRVGNPVAAFWKTVGLVVVGGVVAMCLIGCPQDTT